MGAVQLYVYGARVDRVLDGDTVDVELDLGMRLELRVRVRLWGLNTAERERGREATAWLRTQLPVGADVIVRTELDRGDKYGRLLGVLWTPQRAGDHLPQRPSWAGSLNEQLVELGLASPWDGQGAAPTPA